MKFQLHFGIMISMSKPIIASILTMLIMTADFVNATLVGTAAFELVCIHLIIVQKQLN